MSHQIVVRNLRKQFPKVLAVAGVCAAIDPGLRAGDVVCATELRREGAEPAALPDSSRLLAILQGRGLQVKSGALFSTDRITSPAERRGLALLHRGFEIRAEIFAGEPRCCKALDPSSSTRRPAP